MTHEVLRYGEKDGQLVGIVEVERGVACGCSCPACGRQLIALKGERQIHRFEHFRELDCGSSVQVAIRKLVKDILEKNRKILLPAVGVEFGEFPRMTWELSGEREIAIEQVTLNTSPFGSFPDLVIHSSGQPLVVEVTMTPPEKESDGDRRNRLEASGLSIIELVFDETEEWPSPAELEAIILGSDKRKRWLVNRKAEQVKATMKGLAVLKHQEFVCDSVEPKGLSRLIVRRKRSIVDDYRTCRDCYYCVGGKRGEVLCSLDTGIRNVDEYRAYMRKHGIGLKN